MKKTTMVILIAALILAPFILNGLSLPFLQGADIRDSAMAGSSAPFSNGPSSAYVNPACLAAVPMQGVNILYYPEFENSQLSSLSYALPMLDHGTTSVSLLMLDSGRIDERDGSNILLGTYGDTYTQASLSYGISLFQFLYAGVSAKYLFHNFYQEQTGCFTSDFGIIALFPFNINISALAGNLFKSDLKYTSGSSDTLPVYGDVTAGISFRLLDALKDSLKISAGFEREEYDSSSYYHAGAEYSFYSMFALRCGVNNDGFTLGAAVAYDNAEFNYALIDKPLGFVNRFSVGYNFGENVRAVESQFRTKEAKAKYELIEKIKRDTIEKFEQDITDSMKSGDLENARITAEKALVWSPDDPWFTEKDREITDLINADKVKTYLAEADTLMKQDSYIDAMVSLKNVLDIDPKNQTALDKFARAQELVKTLGENNLSIQEGNKEAIKQHFEAGLNNYAAGNYEKAIDEWDMVIKASPLQRMVYNYIQSAQNKVKKSEEVTNQKKLDRDKKLQALYNDAVVQYSKGEFEKAIGLWREYLKQDPDNAEAKDNLEKITKEYMELQKQKLEW
jgi:tetratricopeptide (TPR) repeat protein